MRKNMETVVKKPRVKVKSKDALSTEQPVRLSKAGQWRRDNPGGIIVVLDRRAVNK